MDKILIATGMKCPRPLIEVHKAVKDMDSGEVLEVRADDPAFKLDIEAWCRRTGNDLLELHREEDTFTALVRCGRGPEGS